MKSIARLTGSPLNSTVIALWLVLLAAPAARGQYSQNVVGYINLPITAGWTLVVNQLNTTNNGANFILISGPPDGSLLYRFDPVAQDYQSAATYVAGIGWYPPSGNTNDLVLDLPLGEGFLVWSPSTWTNLFLGEVMQGTLVNPLPLGFSLKGSIVPQAGLLQTTLAYPAHDGDSIWLGVPGSLTQYDYADAMWSPTEPSASVGRGFFVYRSVANQPWTRNFTVNRPVESPPPEAIEPLPGIESFKIEGGVITLKVNKATKRYNVQYSADRESWTTIAANQTATTWRGKVPPGPHGFFQVTKS